MTTPAPAPAPAAPPKPVTIVVSIAKAFVQDSVYPVVRVHADNAPEPNKCYAWVRPGKVVTERLDPIKERRVGKFVSTSVLICIGKCLRDDSQIAAFAQQFASRKEADAGTFASELGKFLTSISVPPTVVCGFHCLLI